MKRTTIKDILLSIENYPPEHVLDRGYSMPMISASDPCTIMLEIVETPMSVGYIRSLLEKIVSFEYSMAGKKCRFLPKSPVDIYSEDEIDYSDAWFVFTIPVAAGLSLEDGKVWE